MYQCYGAKAKPRKQQCHTKRNNPSMASSILFDPRLRPAVSANPDSSRGHQDHHEAEIAANQVSNVKVCFGSLFVFKKPMVWLQSPVAISMVWFQTVCCYFMRRVSSPFQPVKGITAIGPFNQFTMHPCNLELFVLNPSK